jgi:hypothetical protein
VGAPVSGVVDAADEGAVTLVVGVLGVVLLLGALLPPPHPTAKTSTAAPPNTAKAVLASDLIGLPILVVLRCLPLDAPAQTGGCRTAKTQ